MKFNGQLYTLSVLSLESPPGIHSLGIWLDPKAILDLLE
jgi:hypothetical protein